MHPGAKRETSIRPLSYASREMHGEIWNGRPYRYEFGCWSRKRESERGNLIYSRGWRAIPASVGPSTVVSRRNCIILLNRDQ